MKTGKTSLDLPAIERIIREIRPMNQPEKRCLDATAVFLLLFDILNPHLLAVLKSDTEGYPWRNQVALPGGHVDERDDTALDAAFRELEEELQITRKDVRYIGPLGHFQTINNKDIEVFAGVWNGRGSLRFDKAEISRILKLPISTLLQIHVARGYHGRLPGVLELSYPVEDVQIWGVTGKILHFLLEQLYSVFVTEIYSAAGVKKGSFGKAPKVPAKKTD